MYYIQPLFQSTFGMLVWLLPTFLWPGEPLHENDRPFRDLFNTLWGQGHFNRDYKRRDGEGEEEKLEERITPILNPDPVESSWAKVYNRVFSPEGIAKVATINAVGVS